MKKLISILVLGLLFSGVASAKTIELDQGIKINIPKGYEYLQFNQLDYMRKNSEGLGMSKSKIDELVKNTKVFFGMNGSETSTIIGKKGYAKGYGSLTAHTLSGNAMESWDGLYEFGKKCGNKKTEKSKTKCMIKFFNMDPMFQIDVGNGTSEFLKEAALALDGISIDDRKDIEDFNKSSFNKIKERFSKIHQSEINIKVVKIKNKIWGFETLGEDITAGITTKKIGYTLIHNEHPFVITGFCFSKASCKNIKKMNNDIIEPYLSMNLQNKKTVSNNYVDSNSSIEVTDNSNSNAKIAKKYSLKGERPLALSWDGYSDLIAGKVKFNEADSKGSVNFVLPNNDGTCEGSYNLQQQGKGTWQISCTNNMGTAGTINWVKNGSVTGTGRDYKDKKVKFTISQ